jgi:hypothetical protein
MESSTVNKIYCKFTRRSFRCGFTIFFALLISGCINNAGHKIEFVESITNVKNQIYRIQEAKEIEFNVNSVNKFESDSGYVFITKLINCANLPSEDDSLRALGEKIAILMKRKLKEPENYKQFAILFVTRKDNALMTNDEYFGYRYFSKDLDGF